MAESNKILFLLLVSLTIFPAHALDVIFSNALEDFKQQSKINIYIEDGEKIYCSTLNPLTYQPKPDTSKVIVYIIDKSRYVEIIRNAVRETRLQIAQELKEWHCELVFLGIDNFDDDEYHLISVFILDKIQPHYPNETNFTIETIGEDHFHRVYGCYGLDYGIYQENAQICRGTLKARLRNIARGALRPVGNNGKEIKLYGYYPYSAVAEVTWPVSVVNNTYFPEVNISDPKYNFRIRFKKKKICLLILSGKEYSAVTNYGKRWKLKMEMPAMRDEMANKDEGLIILGVFNFDWTEIDIVTQIILQHSVGWKPSYYNVFTCGYGMFNTIYLNVYEEPGRYILQQPKSSVSELIKVLVGKEVRQRSINMFYSDDNRWDILDIPIILYNGRYFPTGGFENYRFLWLYPKIAFIVYNSTETNDGIDFRMVDQFVEELKWSGLYVVLIEAINFGLDDMHIIAEWIDCHRGVIGSKQIAVLGGGVFDTIFQSELTTYSTLFDTKKNELERIRNIFVNKGEGKAVFAAKLFDPEFEVWTYPMNTVNGFYEPDLIPDQHMFDTTDRKKIFFIITSAYIFHQISEMEKTIPITSLLRDRLERHYPYSDWSVYLVGFDNFEERDYHLFAELVEMQTNDERPLHKFVYAFNYGIGPPTYQYKDTPPIEIETRFRIESHIISFFKATFYSSNGVLFTNADECLNYQKKINQQ